MRGMTRTCEIFCAVLMTLQDTVSAGLEAFPVGLGMPGSSGVAANRMGPDDGVPLEALGVLREK